MTVPTGGARGRPTELLPAVPRGAKVLVLPVRRKPRPPRWWQRVLRRLRYGRRRPSGGA